ncbi:LysR family transcriptional regulator [Falsiroseomonas sp.]|uniref:LysR family transcriptional regulator n=1 Tax=Falsiroseomonas sp. TaxID=2870721 RepID=UPI003F6EB2A3
MPDADALPRLRDLAAFAAASRAASLGAAARQAGLTQPALSQAIGRLEARIGQALLARGPRGSFPSPAGALLLERCARMDAQLEAGLAACGSTTPPRLLTDTALATHLAITRAGSFAAAARARGISLPTLSRTARGLEATLGVALYRRTEAGFVAGPDGAELARRIALARVEIEQALAELAAEPARFHLGTLPLMPRLPLAVALEQAGALDVSAQDGSHAALVAQLRQGRIDAMLGALRGAPPHPDLEEEALRDDPFVVACGAAHPGDATPAGLAAAAWVVAAPPLPRRAVAEALFATLPARPSILLETNAAETTIAVLRQGGAMALLSAQQVAATPGLRRLPVPLPPTAPRRIGLTLRRDWQPTPAQAGFLEALRAACRDG